MDRNHDFERFAYEPEEANTPILDDVTAEAQYTGHTGSGSDDSSEMRLMLAILSDAVSCVRQTKWSRASAEALEWILEEASDRFCSFDDVCETLGLDPSCVRRKVLESIERSSSVAIPVLSHTRKRIIPIRVAA